MYLACAFAKKHYLCTAFCGSEGCALHRVTEWKGLSRGVMVAQQVLVLFVKVRILARQLIDKFTIFAASKEPTRALGVVVQLVRIPACHAGGRGFESRPFRQLSRDNEAP